MVLVSTRFALSLISSGVVVVVIRYFLPSPVGLFPQLGTLALASVSSFLAATLGANMVRKQVKTVFVSSLNTLLSRDITRKI